jgi:hypothetical protein
MLVVSPLSSVGGGGSSGTLVLPVETDKIPCRAKSEDAAFRGFRRIAGCCGRSLGGEAFGDERPRRRFPDICRRRGSFFLDLGEQPGLNHGGGPLSLHIIAGETASLEDYGAQLGDAAAASVIEVHKRKAGPRHRILQQRDPRCRRQAMFAAQVQKSADKAVAAVSVIITAARPAAVVGKKLEHEIEQLHRFCDLRFEHWFDRSRSG